MLLFRRFQFIGDRSVRAHLFFHALPPFLASYRILVEVDVLVALVNPPCPKRPYPVDRSTLCVSAHAASVPVERGSVMCHSAEIEERCRFHMRSQRSREPTGSGVLG